MPDAIQGYTSTHTIDALPTESRVIFFEPWGISHTLQAGQSLHVVAVSETPGELEVEHEPGCVTVYGWGGSTFRARVGEEIVFDIPIACPDFLVAMSPKGFVDMMFGGPGGPERA